MHAPFQQGNDHMTTFKNLAEVALAFDALAARVEQIAGGGGNITARDLQYLSVRNTLEPYVRQILNNYNGVELPPINPATGMMDKDALNAALNPFPPGHPHNVTPAHQSQLRRFLSDMGRI
jgi:hypothetical protein